MKILQINKFNYIEGGAERYYTTVSSLLNKYGNEVAYFSMKDARNYKTKWQKYFVSNISFRDVNMIKGFKNLKRMIYSIEAKNKINELLDVFKPDIVHIHQIYNHISPSILPEIKKKNIPIILTVHDYNLLAPNRNLFHDDEICEITKPDKYYKALLHKCVKKSYFATFASVITLYIHRLFRLYSNNIDYYIAPSIFVKNKLLEYGFDNKKIIHISNFIDTQNYSTFKIKTKKSKYVLYCGRLSSEKGLLFLLKIAKKLPSVKFKILGEGDQKAILYRYVKSNYLLNVDFLDYQEGEKLKQIILDSNFLIFPSLWFEPFGLSILESFTLEKPVIASNIGGIPEVVKDGVTGLLFAPGNINDCRKKILKLWNSPKTVRKMGINAKEDVQSRYNPEEHYKKLMDIYKQAIQIHKQSV